MRIRASGKALIALPLLLLLSSCAKDIVLPDLDIETVCGNGVLESGEACDVSSPGCSACSVVPNWTCTLQSCTQLCGDGVISNDTSCASPKRDTDCDMSGYWAGRATDYSRDTILNGIQVSSNWYLFRFAQTGDNFTVVEEMDCGTHVTGSATVDSTPGLQRALLYRNRMDGVDGRPARAGTSKAENGGCAVTFDRWYSVRGAAESFLPSDFAAKPELSTLTPLPSVKDPVNGTDDPAGAEDIDGDGIPGAAFSVAGIVTGIRNSAQRDWREYATLAGQPVAAAALTIAIPASYDLQESVIRVSDCGSGCPLLAAGANAARDIKGRMTLSFLGKSYGSARVGQVVAGVPRKDIDSDLSTCAKVRLVLPHDPTKP